MPGGIHDSQGLLLFEFEITLRAMGNLETLGQPQPDQLFREPLPRILGLSPEDPVPKLLVFCVGIERHSVYLLRTEGARDVLQHCEARQPKVACKQLSRETCALGLREPRRNGLA